MKVPCTECKQLCRRKVVNKGVENLNRIYYKCEACKHKVGWEDELMAGAVPWTKQQVAAGQAQQPQLQSAAVTALQSESAAIAAPQSLPAAAPAPAPLQPAALPRHAKTSNTTTAATATTASIVPAGDDMDVEIVGERAAPTAQEVKADAARTEKPTELPDVQKGSKGSGNNQPPPPPQQQQAQQQVQPRDSLNSAQRGASAQAPQPAAPQMQTHTRAPRRQAAAAAAAAIAAQSRPQTSTSPAAPRQAPSPRPSSGPSKPHPEAGVVAAADPSQVAGPKRKYQDAFVESPGSRPVKRSVQQQTQQQQQPHGAGASAGTAAAAPPPTGAAGPGAGSRPSPSGGVFAARAIPVPGGIRANGVHSTGTSPAAGMADSSGAFGGVFSSREGRGPAPSTGSRQATGSQAGAFPSGRTAAPPPPPAPAAAAVAAAAAASPGARVNSEQLHPQQPFPLPQQPSENLFLTVRNLRRENTVLMGKLGQAQTRLQAAEAAAAALQLRQDPLERELRDLRHKYTDSLQRERQLTEQLNAYKARDRAQQQAAAAAAQRVQQQQAAAQEAAAVAAAARQRAHAQAQAQAEQFAKQYGFYYQHFTSGHCGGGGGAPPQRAPPQQAEYNGDGWYGAAGGSGSAANGGGHAGHPQGRGGGGAGPGRSGGGGYGPDGHMPNGGGAAAGGSGGGAAGGPPPAAEPAAAAPPPGDDPALLAFAAASPPVLDESTSVRALKQFLVEAGAEAAARLCAEKAELLTLARERLNGWEIRRALACSRLSSQVTGDRLLFRLEPEGPPPQQSLLVRASRELMLRIHPDKNPGDEMSTQAFQYLQAAFSRLSPNRQ